MYTLSLDNTFRIRKSEDVNLDVKNYHWISKIVLQIIRLLICLLILHEMERINITYSI